MSTPPTEAVIDLIRWLLGADGTQNALPPHLLPVYAAARKHRETWEALATCIGAEIGFQLRQAIADRLSHTVRSQLLIPQEDPLLLRALVTGLRLHQAHLAPELAALIRAVLAEPVFKDFLAALPAQEGSAPAPPRAAALQTPHSPAEIKKRFERVTHPPASPPPPLTGDQFLLNGKVVSPGDVDAPLRTVRVPANHTRPGPGGAHPGGRPSDPNREDEAFRVLTGDAPPPRATPARPPLPGAIWTYQPVLGTLEPFDECRLFRHPAPPRGYQLIGASVRGKKHKHDGTNRDDWFEVAVVGRWVIVAVSDGAGSKRFSRVGAKAACGAAVRELQTKLQNITLRTRSELGEWQLALEKAGAHGAYTGSDIEEVQRALHAAHRAAHGALTGELQRLGGVPECAIELGRPIELNDLAATLLLAVCQTEAWVPADGPPVGFVMASQIGDGMTGVVHRTLGSTIVLGAPDGGPYAGETEFLTSADKLTDEALGQKTFATLCNIQALMVMTDGVADDYFPANDHLNRLWADLVLNNVPELTGVPDPARHDALDRTGRTLASLARSAATRSELVELAPRSTFDVISTAGLVEALSLGMRFDKLVTDSALLALCRRLPVEKPLGAASPEERLRLWLEAYHVRASFDDRTLVILHRETLP
jgi:hypothetical protein